jgi:hypothetical protein
MLQTLAERAGALHTFLKHAQEKQLVDFIEENDFETLLPLLHCLQNVAQLGATKDPVHAPKDTKEHEQTRLTQLVNSIHANKLGKQISDNDPAAVAARMTGEAVKRTGLHNIIRNYDMYRAFQASHNRLEHHFVDRVHLPNKRRSLTTTEVRQLLTSTFLIPLHVPNRYNCAHCLK